jgi:hypothetical protein
MRRQRSWYECEAGYVSFLRDPLGFDEMGPLTRALFWFGR